MRTFHIQTLGCKVNQYESEQIATLLRRRGMIASDSADADLRIINTCSVTSESASKSRQTIRRAVRLNVLSTHPPASSCSTDGRPPKNQGRVIAMGCWATSNPDDARHIEGVDAVLTHHDDVATEIDRLIEQWKTNLTDSQKIRGVPAPIPQPNRGTTSLPLLDSRHTGHQRAFLKIQDGCDAHCTYCIIPKLRPRLWSKPIEDVIEEARRLVAVGHRELILTGIFLSAFGHETALRRRQKSRRSPLGELLETLCEKVPGLERLRLSSLEPGDLNTDLLKLMRQLPQVAPHFHLPLQSGSEKILRRMNRQYTRNDFLEMLDAIHSAYDRVALTTDIITGFPGETEDDFSQTLDLVDRAKFIHIHAFPYSARPNTAAARWTNDLIPPARAAERVRQLQQRAAEHSYHFRSQFHGEILRIYVEESAQGNLQHGRTAWYFPVHFHHGERLTSHAIDLQIDRVETNRTWGQMPSLAAVSETNLVGVASAARTIFPAQ